MILSNKAAILDAILNLEKCSRLPGWHQSDSEPVHPDEQNDIIKHNVDAKTRFSRNYLDYKEDQISILPPFIKEHFLTLCNKIQSVIGRKCIQHPQIM